MDPCEFMCHVLLREEDEFHVKITHILNYVLTETGVVTGKSQTGTLPYYRGCIFSR